MHDLEQSGVEVVVDARDGFVLEVGEMVDCKTGVSKMKMEQTQGDMLKPVVGECEVALETERLDYHRFLKRAHRDRLGSSCRRRWSPHGETRSYRHR